MVFVMSLEKEHYECLAYKEEVEMGRLRTERAGETSCAHKLLCRETCNDLNNLWFSFVLSFVILFFSVVVDAFRFSLKTTRNGILSFCFL